ncbi:unnamed protein product [Pelagomonas calceolata]|uniref:Tetratricopeptide repeat protein n=1 Tax=Pelagomonas calceolata TaxID=35677 RepID=A0A8J2S8R2_9STRA|nr:unnamed protein product [Pelagomonas calceolata]
MLDALLVVQANLAGSYDALGRSEQAANLYRDVYSGRLKLNGMENEHTLIAANNYASSLRNLKRFKEARSLLRKTIPVARRVLGDSHEITLRMRWVYAETFYKADAATLDDLREAVTTLEDTDRIARRVLGSAHPLAKIIGNNLRLARAVLQAATEK